MNYDPEKYIVVASHNKGKIREFSSLLAAFKLKTLSLYDFPELEEVEETGTSFLENARLKASAISKATGLVALADDSGLEVDALNGEPGVYSARYSAEKGVKATDEKNTEKVLAKLSGLARDKRTGRFICVIIAETPQGKSIVGEGKWDGLIADKPMGENGFGYDPVFVDLETDKTAAQLGAEEKNLKSHRGLAVKDILKQWPEFWAEWLKS